MSPWCERVWWAVNFGCLVLRVAPRSGVWAYQQVYDAGSACRVFLLGLVEEAGSSWWVGAAAGVLASLCSEKAPFLDCGGSGNGAEICQGKSLQRL